MEPQSKPQWPFKGCELCTTYLHQTHLKKFIAKTLARESRAFAPRLTVTHRHFSPNSLRRPSLLLPLLPIRCNIQGNHLAPEMVSLASTVRVADMRSSSVGGSSNLKRKTLDHSSDAEIVDSSQLKRRRVTFDPSVNVQVIRDEDEKSLELVGEEVRRAVEKHAAGEKAAYDRLKALFKDDPRSSNAPHTGLLQKYLIALSNNVHLLDYECKGLVHAVIDCSWVARNEDFVQSYRHFLRSLLSIQTGYTSTVLQMLVSSFVKAPSINARQHDDPPIERVRLQARIHECLSSILRHSSWASMQLSSAISGTFPYPDEDAKTHVLYIRNILRVAQYCPVLKNPIFSIITEKLIKIDVQIQVDMEELEDDLEERLVGDAILDAEEDDSDNDSVSSDESLEPDEQRLKEIRESVTKLDIIMDLLFSHYDAIFEEDGPEADNLFSSLLAQFSNTILPTYRSRHTQFLLFHFSQTSAKRTEQFVNVCSDLAFDQLQPNVLRVTAAAYLASFIARGAHVSPDTVRVTFYHLSKTLEELRAKYEPGCKAPDVRRYGTYYAIAQALLYAFCFRWRDLIITPDGKPPTDEDIIDHQGDYEWYHSAPKVLSRSIQSRLNPLKICTPTIVAQFARMAHHLHFLYVFSLIETNKRIRLAHTSASGYLTGIGGRETALSKKTGQESFLLDAYFPFDPYLLPRSKRWIAEDYVQWKPIPGMPVERTEDDSDEEEDDDDEEEDESDSDREEVDDEAQHEELDDGSTETSI
jgi:RNA polymerase I-specific transcription initiation factor RRN3